MRCERCDGQLNAGMLRGLCPVCLIDAALPEDGAMSVGSTFNYDLLEEIGRGGMGVVYRAIQHGSQRQVAVKMILTEQAATPGVLERFRSEVEAVASLEHPHILRVYEAGESDGMPFYSLKYADGGTLRERLSEFEDPRAAARLVASIARAVHHAHQRGILHRDLKPGNILLDGEDATPYVSDFGLAKWLGRESRLTIAATALGTPNYMAPEQASAESCLTTAADIYSLGAILYELLAGRPPFVADTPIETLKLAAETAAPPLRRFASDVPHDLEVICLKCLAKEPTARYASAAALADDLERWLEGRTIIARPASNAERAWRWAKRNPAVASLAFTTLALVVAVSIGSTIAAARLRVSNERAVAAERQAREELRTASLAEAKATVRSGGMGQRFATLVALKRAGEVRVGSDLRTQAFAALMLPDIRIDKTWNDRYAANSPAAFDSTLERYVVETAAGVLSLRRTADQSEIAQLESPPENPRALYIAPFSARDSKVAVRFANDLVRVYDAESGRLLFELPNRPVQSSGRAFAYDFGFTPDGAELAVGLTSGGVSFHNASNGRETHRLVTAIVPAVIAFSPDDARVALVAKDGTTVEVYHRRSGALEQTLAHENVLFHVVWRPGDAHQLATSSRDNKLYIWDAAAGRQLHVLEGHDGIPPLLAFHPAGRLLASTSRDFTVRLWDVESGECVLNAHGIYGEPAMRFSDDGQRIALGSEGARLSRATFAFGAPCKEIFRCDRSDWYSRVSGMTISPDGHFMAIILRSFGVHLISAETGERLAELPLWPGEAKTAVFTPAGNALIVSGDQSGLWRAPFEWHDGHAPAFGELQPLDRRPGLLVTDAKGEPPVAALYGAKIGKFSLVKLAGPPEPLDLEVKTTPASAHLSRDARFVATDDWERDIKEESDVRVWDTATGELVRRLGVGPNNSVRFSPSGKLLVACGNGPGAGLWRLPELTRVENFAPRGEDAWFVPGDELLGALEGGMLELVRISDGASLGAFPGDTSLSVAFSPDGDAMFFGTSSRFLRWDLPALRRELQAIGIDWADGPK